MFWLLAGVANLALLLSLVLTWLVRRRARSWGWMTGPASRRHVHTLPVPRLGGVAIFGAYVSVVLILHFSRTPCPLLLRTILPAGWMFVIGIIDDLVGVRASRKLMAQILGGVLLFMAGFRVPVPLSFGALGLFLSLAFTISWSVVVMNAINLIDGLDGLASGSSICTLTALLFAAMLFRESDAALFAAVLVGILIGFLRFNVHPATIFLGDSGSLVLGVAIAAITIHLVSASPLFLVVSLLALAHPLAEVVTSTVRRALRAHPIFRPDRRHFHHRLLDRKFSHNLSVLVLIGMSFFFSCLGVLAALGGISSAIAVTVASLAAFYGARTFDYDEFRYPLALARRIPHHRYSVDAHVQLKELRETMEEAASLGAIRRCLEEAFTGLGFADVQLLTDMDKPKKWRTRRMEVELSFVLHSQTDKVGELRLLWDLASPIPIDLQLFSAEFLPVLTRQVIWHLRRHFETEAAVLRRTRRPVLVSSLPPADSACAPAPLKN